MNTINNMNTMSNEEKDALMADMDNMMLPTQEEMIASSVVVKSKTPTLNQIAQLVSIGIATRILRVTDLDPATQSITAGITSAAILRVMYSVNQEASIATYLESATFNIKFANQKNNEAHNKPHHCKLSSQELLDLIEELGYVEVSEGVVTPTSKWTDLLAERVPMTPSMSPISAKRNERLRTSIMKSGVKASGTVFKAIRTLEDTAYRVHTPTLETAQQVLSICKDMAHKQVMGTMPIGYSQSTQYKVQYRKLLNEMYKEEMVMVINGCEVSKDAPKLWSEYDVDARGRVYHVCSYGPNPQASDIARAMYEICDVEEVAVNTPAHDHFLEELADIGGGKFNDHKSRMFVAANPVRSLVKWHTVEDADLPKKPYTYMRMCSTYAEFINSGKATCSLGYGLDAKCSGTQLLAILAGDSGMQEATGLTTSATRVADPYQESLKHLLAMNASYVKLGLDRSFIKTPYMAVQYGGGSGALTGSKEFISDLKERGIKNPEFVKQLADDCVTAITTALGKQINNLTAAIALAAYNKCLATDKEYFNYRHSDGQVVKQPAYPKVIMCEAFTLRFDELEQIVFGQLDDLGKPTGDWKVTSEKRDAKEYARKWMVNYIQGLDALIARTFIVNAKAAGMHGITSIHDCFRCALSDVPTMKGIIADTYRQLFVDQDQLAHLKSVMAYQVTEEAATAITAKLQDVDPKAASFPSEGGLNYFADNKVTTAILNSPNAYYFCI